MSLLRRFPFHPFLLAIYPALALLAYNIREVNALVVIRPLLFSLALALVLLGIFRLVFKHWLQAALAASLILVLFFSYGHLYEFLKGHPIFGVQMGRYRLLIPAYLVLMGLGLWWVRRGQGSLSQLTLALNTLAAFLLVFPLVQMGGYAIQQAASQKGLPINPGGAGQLVSRAAQDKPDI